VAYHIEHYALFTQKILSPKKGYCCATKSSERFEITKKSCDYVHRLGDFSTFEQFFKWAIF
jgi:hypothetical protein